MYPDEFYYEITISASGFQKEVSSQFDIQRLLQHRSDIWVAPTPKVKKMRKDIVFDSRLLRNIPYKYRPDLIQLINEMIEHGFSVYYKARLRFSQFKKDFVAQQLDDFFFLSDDIFYADEKDEVDNKHTFILTSKDLCFKLLKIDALPEHQSHEIYYSGTVYNSLINECLEFTEEIPDVFYQADLSNLFELTLKEIHISAELMVFLKALPIKKLELISCRIDKFDFLSDKVIYLAIEGSLSSTQQADLLGQMEHLKHLRLVVDEPDDSLVSCISSLHPNLVRLETNLQLSLVLSRFPNMVEYRFTNQEYRLNGTLYPRYHDRIEVEAGITNQTNPRLKSIRDMKSGSFAVNSEKDRHLINFLSNFPNIVGCSWQLLSSFVMDVSTPFPKVHYLKIIVNESFSFDQISKVLSLFPSCEKLELHGNNRWRMVSSDFNNILMNTKHQIANLVFHNLDVEKSIISDLYGFISPIKILSFSNCVFESDALSQLSKYELNRLTDLKFDACSKKISRFDSTLSPNITFIEIYKLLFSAPILSGLSLTNSDIDMVQGTFEPVKSICDLTVTLSHIDEKVFSELISILPSVDTLALLADKPKSDFYYIPAKSLPLIEEPDDLYIQGKISRKQWQVFLNATNLDESSDDYDFDEQVPSLILVNPDTGLDPNKKFYLERYFWLLSGTKAPIGAASYRMNIMDRVNVHDEPVPVNQVFSLSRISVDISALDQSLLHVELMDHEAVQAKFKNEIEDNAMLVKGKFRVSTRNQWVQLPSYKSNEKIVGYHIVGESDDSDHMDMQKHEIKFSYSPQGRLYYVKTSSSVTIVFYLLIAPTLSLSSFLNPEILKMVKFLKSFTPSEIKPQPMLTTLEFYNFVIENKTGACRIRAVVFKLWMENFFPEIPTQIVMNECHAFAEVFFDGDWIKVNLGGYPAAVNYIGEISAPSTEDSMSCAPSKNDVYEERRAYFQRLMKNSALFQARYNSGELLEIMKLCVEKPQKILLECVNQEKLIALQYGLQASLKAQDAPYCYIHYPDSLDCQHQTLAIGEDFQGYFTAEPNSNLYQFLKKGVGVLIINYEHFTPEQFAQFNDMLDDVRQIKGLPIPSSISIIGLINTRGGYKKPGEDFYSRFDRIEPYQGKDDVDCEFLFDESSRDAFQINLYESDNWESMLIGQWLPSVSGWIFQPGLLTLACLNGMTSINIHNGPWHLESFCHFWRQAKIDGYFSCADFKFDISAICFSKSQGYVHVAIPRGDRQTKLHVLSEYTYGFFFQNFEVNGQSLVSLPGFIEQAGAHLSILITGPISKPQWMRFLDKIHERGMTLHVTLAPNVTCEFLDEAVPTQCLELTNTQLIHTNDIDGFLSTRTDDVIIDISECNGSDLVSSVQIKFQDSGSPFVFSIRKGFLEKCLEKGASVILKGDFKPHLVYEMLPFLLENHPGVSLVFEDKKALEFFKVLHCPINKKALLEQKLSLERLPFFINLDEPYSKCLARYYYWERTGDTNTENNWQGLSELEVAHKTPEECSFEDCIEFRRAMIERVLKTQPYVFIAGLSGVGKTTFIQENFLKVGEQLFIGQEQLQNWLNAASTESIFLFVDEANLTPTEWSVFEGLFLERPAIFYEGVYYLLSPNHKVIFAGNPMSYGGERELSVLFKKHGNTIVFKPLSISFIEAVVLKPILPSNPWLISQILSIYFELCKHSTNEVLITPRELKTLALFGKLNALTIPYKMVNLFNLNVQFLLENRLPKERKEFIFREMELNRAKLIDFPLFQDVEWGETHRQALYMMQQFLNLHLYRKNNELLSDEQKYGGLSGLVLEGEPGLGKTKMVEMMLTSNKIDMVRISASESLANKRALLYDAFNQGRVVWIDEFNSAPLLEKELNAYLSGYNLKGERPSRPGFLLIATQNPSHMMGRRMLSPALLRRVLLLQIAHYTTPEMIKILNRMGMTHDDAECFVTEYINSFMMSSCNFRHFLKFAKSALAKEEPENKKRSRDTFFAPNDKKTKIDKGEATPSPSWCKSPL